MIISRSKKFIFLHVPKTAGTSLRNALKEHATLDTYELETYPDELGGQGHMQQSYLLESGLWSEFQGYYEFAVVREPLQRLVGIYNYNFRPRKYGKFSRFAQHVKLTYQNRPHSNLFYHSQLEWLEKPLTDQVHVYKFENLINNVDPLSQALGIDLILPHDNNNKSKVLSINDLTEQEVKYCLDFLSEEYDRLGYAKP